MRHRIACLLSTAVVAALSACSDSPYVNCLVAPSPTAFTGEKLKHDGTADGGAVLKEACIAKDRELDSGDGEQAGRVRWVQCLRGPDCDEAGMF